MAGTDCATGTASATTRRPLLLGKAAEEADAAPASLGDDLTECLAQAGQGAAQRVERHPLGPHQGHTAPIGGQRDLVHIGADLAKLVADFVQTGAVLPAELQETRGHAEDGPHPVGAGSPQMPAKRVEGLELFGREAAADNLSFDFECGTAATLGCRCQWSRLLHRTPQPVNGSAAQIAFWIHLVNPAW